MSFRRLPKVSREARYSRCKLYKQSSMYCRSQKTTYTFSQVKIDKHCTNPILNISRFNFGQTPISIIWLYIQTLIEILTELF